MSTEEERKALEAILDKHVAELGEFFQSVQVFVSNCEDDGAHTHSLARGSGNWYARFGHVAQWLARQDERERYSVWRDAEDEDEGEE